MMKGFNYLRVPPELLQAVLDNPYEGTVIIDAEGIIRHFSKANEPFYGITTEEVIGRHILDVIPESGLPNVVRTGRAEVGDTFSVKGRHVVVNRYPIKIGERVIGAVGKVIFHDLKAVANLRRKVKQLESTLKRYESELRENYQARYSFADLVGMSPRLVQAREMAKRFAVSDSPVLLMGESGTGKEIFAHSIHRASPRRGHPFIRVNCTSIPGELFESELFGYEAGAFTGAARSGKPGKFELAHKGTIFLDEIGELPLGLQGKLLRVLQEKEIEPLGARRPKTVDFRVIAATNRDLEERARDGYFRKDLFYRLNVVSIMLPPLREMKDDIPALAEHFLRKLRPRMSTAVQGILPEVMTLLLSYDWPGNVRELQNVIERAISLCTDSMIALEHLPEGFLEGGGGTEIGAPPGALGTGEALHLAVSNAEREQLIEALRRTGGNRTLAASLLNIHRTTLYYRMKKFGVRRMDLAGG
jgi:transcriptional regulator with PAS, ATPase and Fis domain